MLKNRGSVFFFFPLGLLFSQESGYLLPCISFAPDLIDILFLFSCSAEIVMIPIFF